MKRLTTGGGWAAIRYTLRMANRVGWRRLWKAMRAKNACKTCALGMGGQAGGMRNEAGPLARGLQEVAAGHGRRHAGGPRGPSSSRSYSHRPAAGALAARAGMVRPADARRCYAGPGDTHYRADRLGRGARRASPAQLQATPPDETLLLRQRPVVERGRLPAATVRPAVRHELRQQLLATTATRPAASG